VAAACTKWNRATQWKSAFAALPTGFLCSNFIQDWLSRRPEKYPDFMRLSMAAVGHSTAAIPQQGTSVRQQITADRCALTARNSRSEIPAYRAMKFPARLLAYADNGAQVARGFDGAKPSGKAQRLAEVPPRDVAGDRVGHAA